MQFKRSLVLALAVVVAGVAPLTGAKAAVDPETNFGVSGPLPSGLEIRQPAPGGVSFSEPLTLDIRYAGPLPERYTLQLDGRDVTAQLRPGTLPHQWVAEVPGVKPGARSLQLFKAGALHPAHTARFKHRTVTPRERLVALADATVERFDPTHMGWDWGEGLLLFALSRLDAQRYRPFIEAYYAHHLAKGLPPIDWSDKCAPALAALELYRETGDPKYKAICEQVVAYLKQAKPTPDGGLNHMGHWWVSNLYPQSMWVDSLMMYNVFAARWGKAMNDPAMSRFAAAQPLAFAGVLQDPKDKLWRHAWFNGIRRNAPERDVYWLRGNGWAMASFPETLDQLPAGTPERARLLTHFQDQAAALAPYQSETGLWHTVLNRPGKTYLETSGSALVAFGMLKGVHQGYLKESFRAPGRKAYLALLDRLQEKPEGPSMPEISHNTLPYNMLGYSLVPQRNDLAFGLAAMLLAGIEFEQEQR